MAIIYVQYNKLGEIIGQVGWANSTDNDVIGIDDTIYNSMSNPMWDWNTNTLIDAEVNPINLQNAKDQKILALKEIFEDKRINGHGTVTVNSIIWDAGLKYQENIEIEIAPIIAGRLTEQDLNPWKDSSGTFHQLTLAQFQSLNDSIEDWLRLKGTQLYAVKWQHEESIKALTTIQEINNYDITINWPV